jgi:hypothetical protein
MSELALAFCVLQQLTVGRPLAARARFRTAGPVPLGGATSSLPHMSLYFAISIFFVLTLTFLFRKKETRSKHAPPLTLPSRRHDRKLDNPRAIFLSLYKSRNPSGPCLLLISSLDPALERTLRQNQIQNTKKLQKAKEFLWLYLKKFSIQPFLVSEGLLLRHGYLRSDLHTISSSLIQNK